MKGLGRVAGMVLVFVLAVSAARVWAAPLAQGGQGERHIAYGQRVEGFIGAEEGEERWVFSGAAGDVVLIEMNAWPNVELDPLVSLLDASGNTLASDDDGGLGLNSRLGPYTLPVSGQYTILAGRYSGAGEYWLSLRALKLAPTLRPNKTLAWFLNEEAPAEYYQLQAEGDQPQLVRVQMNVEGEPTTYRVTLFGPDGQTLVSTTAAEENNVFLLLPEVHYILGVMLSEDVGGGGSYTLSLVPSDEGLLRDDVPQRGRLTPFTSGRRHYFIGQAGDVVQVTLETEEDVLPSLSVHQQGEEDTLFTAGGGAMKRVSATLTLPADGAYVVRVYSGEFAPMEEGYTLTVSWQSR